MKAQDIIKRARALLQDLDGDRWTDAELVWWVDEGQKQIAKFPGVFSRTSEVRLVAGTKQTMPADALLLESISHNVDEDHVPLAPVKITTRALLDSCLPMWHQSPESQLVDNYVYDDKDPKHFSVYPPNDGDGRLEITYMAVPATVTTLAAELEIDESFGTALLDWVLYRAYGTDSDYSAGASLSASYYQSYTTEVSMEMQSRSTLSPNLLLKPGVVKENGGTE